MKDIANREDVEFLVNEFYKQVVKDEQIGLFFTEIMALDLEKHLPIMYNFWEANLLGNMVYKGNPMTKHLELNKKEPLTSQHFERWLQLWEKTLTAYFTGPIAQDALRRAQQIAGLMLFKIQQQTHK